MTNAFILTWNPTRWPWPDEQFDEAVVRTAAGNNVSDQWSVGGRRHGIEPGDRAILLRQHSERGIVASGTFTSEIFWGPHWDHSGNETTYATLDWDTVLYPDDRLPTEALKQQVPGVAWDPLQGSGVQVPEASVGVLLDVWEGHAGSVPVSLPDEPTGPEVFIEGGVTTVLANRYERDRRARQKCIEHWGTTCGVCGFDFGDVYGPLGQGFIHVHHLRELAEIGEQYVIDPVKDLRPICPNCHAMLHRTRPALTIAALKKRLRT